VSEFSCADAFGSDSRIGLGLGMARSLARDAENGIGEMQNDGSLPIGRVEPGAPLRHRGS
jgi:hypothetical protein